MAPGATLTLVHFFASWCGPCREELPSLDRLAARAKDRGVGVVAYAVADTEGGLRRFRAEHAIRLEPHLDADRAVARAWGVSTLPTTIVLDAAATPRLVAAEPGDWDRVDLDQLLRAADAAALPGARPNSVLSGDR